MTRRQRTLTGDVYVGLGLTAAFAVGDCR